MNVLGFIVLATCLGMSFFLSGMEAGLFALSRIRIRRLMREGNARARQLHQYLENPEDFLWTILIGNTLANFMVAALTVWVLHNWLGELGPMFWLVFIPGGLVFYAVCDLLPKMLFRLYPNRLCLLFLSPFQFVRQTLRPLVWLMNRISALLLRWSGRKALSNGIFGTRDELRQVMEDSAQKMTSEERTMISRVLDLQTMTVGRVMAPLSKSVCVTTDTPVSEVIALCRDRGVTRLPVWLDDGSHRRIAGLINARALLYETNLDPTETAGHFLKPALYLDENRRLEDAMRHLQRSGQRLAIVLNPERREVGVISLQDILRVVFGEFRL